MISYSLVVVWTGNIIGIAIATTKSVEDLEFCLPDSRTGMQLPDEAKSWQVQHVRNPNVLQRQAPFPHALSPVNMAQHKVAKHRIAQWPGYQPTPVPSLHLALYLSECTLFSICTCVCNLPIFSPVSLASGFSLYLSHTANQHSSSSSAAHGSVLRRSSLVRCTCMVCLRQSSGRCLMLCSAAASALILLARYRSLSLPPPWLQCTQLSNKSRRADLYLDAADLASGACRGVRAGRDTRQR